MGVREAPPPCQEPLGPQVWAAVWTPGDTRHPHTRHHHDHQPPGILPAARLADVFPLLERQGSATPGTGWSSLTTFIKSPSASNFPQDKITLFSIVLIDIHWRETASKYKYWLLLWQRARMLQLSVFKALRGALSCCWGPHGSLRPDSHHLNLYPDHQSCQYHQDDIH